MTSSERMVATNVVALTVALGVQVALVSHGGHSSLSDLPRVFVHRGVGPGALPYVQRVLEYPVGSGILLYLAAVTAPSPIGVLVVTGLCSIGLCVAITVALERRCGARAWWWALGTPLLLFAFENWDVFAIAAMLLGLLAYEHKRDRLAGVALGLGVAVKLFPAILLPALVALRWSRGDRGGARRLASAGAATLVLLNLPFLVLNRGGWWWQFAFQGQRRATWGSAWFWLYRLVGVPVFGPTGVQVANLVSLTALAAGGVCLTLVAVRRNLQPMAVAAAGVAIFMLANKIYSPTYDVWLLAFFVLLPCSRRLWLAFCAVDVAVYVVVYGSFHGVGSHASAMTALPVLVVARTMILLRVIFVATRAAKVGVPRAHAPTMLRHAA